ncbi:MAG: geranylgeranyl diphosphate synthase type II [Candidatus Paceibacteria bacterium]|jgi:geranylgeranyl pyrophosphate synthase
MTIKEKINQFRTEFDPLFEKEVTKLIEEQQQFHTSQTTLDPKLKQAFLDYCAGGKRIRPFLTSFFAEKTLADQDLLNIAIASELFHLAAVVQDDVIDESIVRRGSPTINSIAGDLSVHNKRVGDHVGILLGDVFMVASMEFAAKLPPVIFKEFTTMIQRTIRGQYLDVFGMNEEYGSSSEAEVLACHDLKTAWYTFTSPARIGYMLNNNFEENSLSTLTTVVRELGLLFQIKDDIIDCTDEKSGKRLFGDIFENQTTWATLYIKENYPELLPQIISAREESNSTESLKEIFNSIDLKQPYQEEFQKCELLIQNLPESHSKLKKNAREVLGLLTLK